MPASAFGTVHGGLAYPPGRRGRQALSLRRGEFTVVFPRKTKKDVIPHLENLRESIAGAKFGLRDKKSRPKKRRKNQKRTTNPNTVSVTISIGAAEPGRSPTKPADVIKAADKALYRAKKKGRNCVVG